MARKDVDLVIRAKDEAGKVVDALTGSILDFVKATGGLDKSAGKTDSTLKQLGASIGDLQKTLKGFSVSEKLAQEMDKAGAASQRLTKELEETRAESENLSKTLRLTGQSFDFFQKKAEGAAKAQQKQTELVERSRAAQAVLVKGLADANTARDKGVRTLESLSGKIDKNNGYLATAVERYKRLGAQIAETDNPSKTLQDRFESSANSVKKFEDRIEELYVKFGATKASIAKAAEDVVSFGAKIEASNNDIAKAEVILGKIGENYENAAAKAKTYGAAQKSLQQDSEQLAGALARAQGAVEKTEVEFATLTAAADRADNALATLAGKSAEALTTAFTAQRREMLETKREWVQQEAAVKTYAEEISAAGVPTARMAESLRAAQIAAAGAKTEYEAQRAGLHELSAIMRTEAGTVEELSAKTAAYIEAQSRLSVVLEEVRADTADATRENQRYFEAISRSANAFRTTKAPETPTPPDPSLVDKLSAAYRNLYGDTRQALSYTQRLRGEVLALVSAYGGIFGVIEGLKGVVEATQKIEGVSARLSVVTRGDNDAAAKEFDFIRRNADRLGISLGDLADEYSQFAVATQGTNLEGANTRKIFISVAEAAKVQKLSFADLQGVFKALTQIVSKGQVHLEELSQQLGDRLPGAIAIMADALGVGQAELLKMITNGQVMSDSLIKFAEELDKRFGGQLVDSLKGVTTQLGQLQNAAFQALAAFGRGGYIKGFTSLVNSLTETLSSAQFESFASKVSSAFGTLASILGTVAHHFDVLVIASGFWLSTKLAPFVIALVGQFVTLNRTTDAVAAGMSTAGRAAAASATGAGLAAGAFTSLRVALTALLSSTGIGLLVSAIAIGIGYWVTRTDSATEALNEHRKIVDQVKNAYDATGGSIDKMREKLAGATATQLLNNIAQFDKSISESRKSVDSLFDSLRGAAANSVADKVTRVGIIPGNAVGKGQLNDINELRNAFANLNLPVDKYIKSLDEIGKKAATPAIQAYTASLIDEADATADLEQKRSDSEKALTVLTGSKEDAKKAADDLAGVTTSTAAEEEKAAKATHAFSVALDTLNDLVPDVDDKFKNLKAEEKLNAAYEAAKKAAEAIQDVTAQTEALSKATAAYNAGMAALNAQMGDKAFQAYGLGSATSGAQAAEQILRREEGFQPVGKLDVNAFRAGFGSDTVTLADGSIQKITQGMQVSRADADRDLLRRVQTEFLPKVSNQLGSNTFDALSSTQQGVLGSIAYNYGSLPDRLVDAFRKGSSPQEIADLIAKDLGTDNGGARQDRYNRLGALYASDKSSQDQDKDFDAEQKKISDAADKKVKDQQDLNREIDQTVQKTQSEASTLKGTLLDREIEKELVAQRQKAEDKGLTLSAEQEAAIRKAVTARYAEESATDEQKKKIEAAKKAEEEVNNILSERKSLQDELKTYEEAGDTSKVEETRAKIAGLNDEMQKAKDNAVAMWNKVGGTEAAASVEKINASVAATGRLGKQADAVYWDWSKVSLLFADGLTNAFSSFAKQVGQGVPVFTALRNSFLQFASDFLMQIAEMILKAAILNALGVSSSGATTGGGLMGSLGIVFGAAAKAHTGGVVHPGGSVGAGSQSQRISPAVFAHARRFHEGGVPGLAPDEVPVITRATEEIIKETDPRHINNLRNQTKPGSKDDAGSSAEKGIRNIIVMDPKELANALASSHGDKVLLNFVRKNKTTVKQVLGV